MFKICYNTRQAPEVKQSFILYFSLFVVVCSVLSCSTNTSKYNYVPDDLELYNTIVHMDSVYFNAYNTCDLKTQADLYSEEIEFFHDKGGLMTSKPGLLDALEKNICGKVTRELVQGSIEVYPIKDYGAVEIGLHKFHNNQEPEGTISKIGKFVMMWEFKNDTWKITKVISLH